MAMIFQLRKGTTFTLSINKINLDQLSYEPQNKVFKSFKLKNI